MLSPKAIHLGAALWIGVTAALATACAGRSGPPRTPIAEIREDARASSDPSIVSNWLLAELVSPGGKAGEARKARARLDALRAKGMLSHLARGIDDAVHGQPSRASEHFLRATQAARDSADPRASLVAWFAVEQTVRFEAGERDMYPRWKAFVEHALADPRAIGWRARGTLADYKLDQAWAEASRNVEDRAVEVYGCLTKARLAGPFGTGASTDAVRRHPPESPGAWQGRWEPAPGVSRPPVILQTEQRGCAIGAAEPVEDGVFYAEAFFELDEPREVLVAVQGALAVRLDDELVLDRDLRRWGIWPKFGVEVRLAKGRHRLVARLGEPTTSIRVMRPDGTPLPVRHDADPARPYETAPPVVLREPNDLSRLVTASGEIRSTDDLTRYLAAYLAHVEGSDDLASVLLEPLIADLDLATGPALSAAAVFAQGDPIFEKTQSADLVRELQERAAEKDAGLWAAQVSLALGDADRKGVVEAVPRLERLSKAFPDVAAASLALARIYGELGWVAEHAALIKDLERRFPHEVTVLHAAVDVYDEEGDKQKADELVKRIVGLDPDAEIRLTRALAQENYDAALAELEKLSKRRPERKDFAERIHDVLVRSGNESETWKKLEAAVEKSPRDGRARLELADARFASGKHGALRRALAEAVEAGAEKAALTNAIDLVEAMTALEPYRLDPLPIIEAYEKSEQQMPGTAARVLDYAALWVHADGSSHMLEHELVRLQSEEAIGQFAEHRRLGGLVLQMRVIKPDGTMLEPEDVAGKPTVTFPHLEVGDYIETEQVVYSEAGGRKDQYLGPRWFFREEKVAYARSEFVVIAPEVKNLVVETTGDVPEPEVIRDGALTTRRYRVDFSPAAPVEPHSAPITEFLPSVRIGWGITLATHLSQLSDAVADVVPIDPRIVRIARKIVHPLPASDELGRARRLYHWVLDNVEDGEEADGRRVIVSKNGNRWRGFIMLCRALGISADYAVAKNRLVSPPVGPISEAASLTQPVIRVRTKQGERFVTLGNKFAPFGYMPAEVRGMPAYFLGTGDIQAFDLPAEGADDNLTFQGRGRLAADGSAEIDLVQRYTGRLAMTLRNGLAQLPEKQLKDALETNLLARSLEGARLVDYSIEGRDDLDVPLVIRMQVKVRHLARPVGASLSLPPPFALPVGQLAALPSRQTPLLIAESIHRVVDLAIELPKGATARVAAPVSVKDGDRHVARRDRVEKGVLHLEREAHIPAGRVQPEAYSTFARFVERADDALSTTVTIEP